MDSSGWIFKRVKVIRVVDGDTFDAIVDTGFYHTAQIRFRLRGIDTPETHRPSCPAEYLHGMLAKKFLEEAILNKKIFIVSFKEGVYNRWDAEIILEDGSYLAPKMVAAGLQKLENYI